MSIKNDLYTKRISTLLHQADIYFKLRQNERAITWYKEALSMGPCTEVVYYHLAVAHTRLGLFGSSIEVLEKATKTHKSVILFNLLGKCLLITGEINKANQAYLRAIKINKNNIESIAGIASVFAKKGRYSKAYKLLEPYMNKNVINQELANTATNICLKLGQCDDVLNYLLMIDSNKSVNDGSNKGDIRYMIADIFDSKKQYHDAVRYYIMANETKTDNYSPYIYDKLIESIKSVYNPGYFMQCDKSANESNKPIFIVGMPRSGTTLVEQILASHSRVYGAGELSMINGFKNDCESTKNQEFPECASKLSAVELNGYSDHYLDCIDTLSNNADYVVDKMPHNFVYLGFISQLFPKSKIIYCTRNPIDTCLSIYFTRLNDTHPYATRFNNLSHQYKLCKELMAYWKNILSLPILEVNYEALVSNPENVTNEIINFCGLDMEKRCLEFYNNERFVNTASSEQVVKPIYKSSVVRWKRYMPDIQLLVDALENDNLI